jgi:hypothetical protein
MGVYKTLYMQNAIWSLLQDCICNMNKQTKITLSNDKVNGY